MSKWTPGRMRQLAEDLESFKTAYRETYAEPDGEQTRASLSHLDAVVETLRRTRLVAQRENAIVTQSRRPVGRKR